MSRYFRLVYCLSIALVCFLLVGCCCPRQVPCGPPAAACAPHACCPSPSCPQYWPLHPGAYSENMYPYLTPEGNPRLVPQSGLKTLMAP